MAKRSPHAQSWLDGLRPAARRRGMRFAGGTAFALDEVLLASLEACVLQPGLDPDHPERLRIAWAVDVKPLAVDDVLWAAFLPDAEMGARKRIDRRVNGAFQVRALRIAEGVHDVAADDEPDWAPVLDAFGRARDGFAAAHPTVADFAALLEREDRDGRSRAGGQELVRLITTLIAAERAEDAARIAEDAIARGVRGPMGSTVDVLKYLAAYARGPEAYAAFTASLASTHDVQVISEAPGRSSSVDLARAHHRGRFGPRLASLDGADPWAVVLVARPPAGAPDDHSTSRYLQAAGAARAMTVELCRPGGAQLGAVSVRSVVGRARADAGEAPLDVEIALPHGAERIAAHEAFTAEEATELFDAFYRTGELPDGCALRPVEGFAADGTSIDLRGSAG